MTALAPFGAALLDADAPVPDGLSDGRGTPATKRFSVYRNNVAVSLTEALETAFPVVRALVGDAFFKALAGVFLRAHPPKSPVMMFYGAEMPAFLKGFAPAASLPYLADVARVEQAVRHAYHASDVVAVDADKIGTLAPEALMASRFTLAPAVTLIESAYPVGSIWRANMENGPKPGPTGEDVVISRPGFDPMVDVLEPGAAVFLRALSDGLSFGDAAEHAAQTPGFDLSACLTLCLTRGLLTTRPDERPLP